MNLDSIKALATSKIARQALLARKHSPKALFIAGTVGVIGATVLACRATLKMDEVLEKAESDRFKLSEMFETSQGTVERAYNSDMYKRDLNKLKVKTGLEIAKLYAPAVGVGAAAIGALTGSHFILSKRNSAAMAAYVALDRGYKEYRQRVVDEYGKDVDRKFSLGAEDRVVEEKTAEGKTITKKEAVIRKDGKFIGGSPYAVVFDERSKFFSREPGMNAQIVAMKQSYANDKLRAKGHLFLNDVYEMLGLPVTKAGQIVGWVWRGDDEPKNGDNYVSFGIFDGEAEWVEAFLDGTEKYAVLDFNVDGPILDLI